MRILIEEYQYPAEVVENIIVGLTNLRNIKGKVSVNHVGYYFNPELNDGRGDMVFILPKVLMEGEQGEELLFGHCNPVDIIDLEKQDQLSQEEYNFIYELSVWVYRAIMVFRDTHPESDIILEQFVQRMSNGRLQECNTYLDILLALQKFNRDNENFFFFVLRNIHSGYNKINWTRTISKSHAVIQNEEPVYINPVNKKRKINFDEELLIIFFSILNYMHDYYGFPVHIPVNFELITGEKFQSYLNGQGRIRLLSIKNKYFSDKAVYLWELCFAFFDQSRRIKVEINQQEYLLVKNFNVVFEAIIDELIAGDQQLPIELKEQEDGKRVDHMYQYRELVNDDSEKNIYYIGDSKYYKRGHVIQSESVYKQFTYARNVVQWNIDLFNDGKEVNQAGHIKLRDDETDGYNVIPNFFISAQQNVLERRDDIHLSKDKVPYHISRQYENRLFDRDTFLLAHYDVNFLFVLALYGRNKESDKVEWRRKARKLFRNEIQQMLKKHFSFYAMTAHADVDAELYIKENFQSVLGKVFMPFEEKDNQQYFSLALRKPESVELKNKAKESQLKEQIKEENEAVLFQLEQSFYIEKCDLGELPYEILPHVTPKPRVAIPKNFLTMHYLENYPDTSFLIGVVNGEEHYRWITSRIGGKRDDAYNVRIGKDIPGGVVRSREEIRHAKFVVLYWKGEEQKGVFRAFRVKNIGEMDKEHMIRTGYVNPHYEKYLCYFFDEEITLGNLDIIRIIEDSKREFNVSHPHELYHDGRPIYLKGEDLLKYRM